MLNGEVIWQACDSSFLKRSMLWHSFSLCLSLFLSYIHFLVVFFFSSSSALCRNINFQVESNKTFLRSNLNRFGIARTQKHNDNESADDGMGGLEKHTERETQRERNTERERSGERYMKRKTYGQMNGD